MRNDQPHLIGIVGYKHSGKNTAADALAGYYQVAFADPIKQMLQVGLGLTHAQCYDQSLKEKPLDWLDGLTPRGLMVSLGTGWGRNKIVKDLWVRVLTRSWHTLSSHVVVTDARMQNEVDALRDQGATILHLRRGKPEGWFKRLKRRLFAPASEQYVRPKPGDIVIFNDCSLDEFQHRVRCAVLNTPTSGVVRIK